MKPVLLLVAMASLCVAVAPASAGSVSKSIQVTATVEPYCAIVAAPDLSFGSYTAQNVSGGLGLDATAVISVICPQDLPYTISLDTGLHGMAEECTSSPAQYRGMTSQNVFGGNLGYDLYTDEAHTTVWGCSPETVRQDVGANTIKEYTIYGRVEPGQVTYADSYADTLTITVNF